MTHKRLTLFAGHYGSGKTNIALNYARWLRRKGEAVTVADLDIINPYFRTQDAEEDLKKEWIGLIVSPFANSNLDVRAMPKETYVLIAERDGHQAGNEHRQNGKGKHAVESAAGTAENDLTKLHQKHCHHAAQRLSLIHI